MPYFRKPTRYYFHLCIAEILTAGRSVSRYSQLFISFAKWPLDLSGSRVRREERLTPSLFHNHIPGLPATAPPLPDFAIANRNVRLFLPFAFDNKHLFIFHPAINGPSLPPHFNNYKHWMIKKWTLPPPTLLLDPLPPVPCF